MEPSKLLRASNDGKVEWSTATRCILPVHTAEYTTVILASYWLYFPGHGIKYRVNRNKLEFKLQT